MPVGKACPLTQLRRLPRSKHATPADACSASGLYVGRLQLARAARVVVPGGDSLPPVIPWYSSTRVPEFRLSLQTTRLPWYCIVPWLLEYSVPNQIRHEINIMINIDKPIHILNRNYGHSCFCCQAKSGEMLNASIAHRMNIEETSEARHVRVSTTNYL